MFMSEKGINGRSLERINATIAIPRNNHFWRNLLAFSGPGALVAVGYMDPGNWITSIAGGAQFHYLLLSVVLLSSLMAMLLQYMSAKLGIVTGMDLAQATRYYSGKKTGIILWIMAELAIMATDIAEVIGSAIALKLLFNIPLTVGVTITIFDVFLLLLLMRLGFRKIEALVITLIMVVMLVFAYEVSIAQPDVSAMVEGFVPRVEAFQGQALILSLGIIGATVMPHNLYLHSSIVQSRQYVRDNKQDLHRALKFATWDSNIQLSVAFIVNSLLLVLGAALFFGKGDNLDTFSSLYNALEDPKIVGAVASPVLSILFALALLASGQNSTITGTLTGQIVMEGFVRMRIPAWLRRIITRLLAIIPVLICTIYFGGNEVALDNLLIYSQVFLSLALPISIIPLVWFTSSSKLMGEFKNKIWITVIGAVSTVVLTILNIQLIYTTVVDFLTKF